MGTFRHKKPPANDANRPGRIVVDDRGRNVWQWDDEQLDSTTIMLQQLNNDALAIEPTDEFARPDIDFRPAQRPEPVAPKTEEQAPKPESKPTSGKPSSGSGVRGGGFNPYDNS